MSVIVYHTQMKPIAKALQQMDINLDYDKPGFVLRSYADGLRMIADDLDELVDRLEREQTNSGSTGPVQGGRRAVRVTTTAERAPLYAAYRAARRRGEQIGAECDDDSIIQYAVQAYETAEMARLRAALDAVESLAEDAAAGDGVTVSAEQILRALRGQ